MTHPDPELRRIAEKATAHCDALDLAIEPLEARRSAIDAILDPLRREWQRERLRHACAVARSTHPEATRVHYFFEDDVWKFYGLLRDTDSSWLDAPPADLDAIDDLFPILDKDVVLDDLVAADQIDEPINLDISKVLTCPTRGDAR